jgi:hypothetical protein
MQKVCIQLPCISLIYLRYLRGESLRDLGRAYGCSWHTIRRRIIARYGDQACKLSYVSLVRSVQVDHGLVIGSVEEAQRYLGKGHHRALHTMDSLSTWKTQHYVDQGDRVASDQSPWDPLMSEEAHYAPKGKGLRLIWYLYLVSWVVECLGYLVQTDTMEINPDG